MISLLHVPYVAQCSSNLRTIIMYPLIVKFCIVSRRCFPLYSSVYLPEGYQSSVLFNVLSPPHCFLNVISPWPSWGLREDIPNTCMMLTAKVWSKGGGRFIWKGNTKVKFENKWREAERKFVDYFFRRKTLLCRWGQVHFYHPHLILLLHINAQGGWRGLLTHPTCIHAYPESN